MPDDKYFDPKKNEKGVTPADDFDLSDQTILYQSATPSYDFNLSDPIEPYQNDSQEGYPIESSQNDSPIEQNPKDNN